MTDTLADALANPPSRAPHPAMKLGAGKADITPDGLTITDAVVDQTVEACGNWDHVLALFNLDPAAFEVVDETVRCTTWQQSKGYEDGSRDTVQLYAYSARFRRVTAERIARPVIESWRTALQVRDRTRPAPVDDETGGTYVILPADGQIGKKGTAEAVENWQRGVSMHVEAARKLGRHVKAIHGAFMGDEFEGVANNYGNQAHTVELNQARQIELAYDLEVWTVRELLSLRKPTSMSAVISNHGEWTRNGSKEPVTTQNDNGSTHLARQVKKLFDELAPYTKRHVEWTIGESHPGVVLDLSGVKAYFSHGYVEKGRGPSVEVKTRTALERQILGRTDELGDVALWFMAHYHHFYANTFEGRTLFGCPAIEAERSSEYMLDQFGVWSRPGVLGMLVGENVGSDGWAHVNVF